MLLKSSLLKHSENFIYPLMLQNICFQPSHLIPFFSKVTFKIFFLTASTFHIIPNAPTCHIFIKSNEIFLGNFREYVKIFILLHLLLGRNSIFGIATRYGLDGPGIESRWGRDFRTRTDRPWGPPSLLYNGYRFFPGGKAAWPWC